MRNYFAKLRENEEKGFSLVELIIVMAIMAILVGVVASQVIPYMEKSRQAKDQQQLSGIATDITSAIASSGQMVQNVGTFDSAGKPLKGVEITKALPDTSGTAGIGIDATATEKIKDEFCSLRDTSGGASAAPTVAQIYADIQKKLQSKAAKGASTGQPKKLSDKKIYVAYNVDKSTSYVFMSSNDEYKNAIAKLSVESE